MVDGSALGSRGAKMADGSVVGSCGAKVVDSGRRKRETPCSAELLAVSGPEGIERKFLISIDQSRIAVRPKIKRVPRSGVLDRLQAFLPQMAHANLELRRQMETTGQSHFDIENVDDCPDRVIEMNVSLFELDDVSGAELMSEDFESDTESLGEVTEANLKFPTTYQQRKGRIEVVSGEETKSD